MGLYNLLMDQNQSTFTDLAKQYMVAMMITNWQISHTNCLETLSDWINKQISTSSQFYSLV